MSTVHNAVYCALTGCNALGADETAVRKFFNLNYKVKQQKTARQQNDTHNTIHWLIQRVQTSHPRTESSELF